MDADGGPKLALSRQLPVRNGRHLPRQDVHGQLSRALPGNAEKESVDATFLLNAKLSYFFSFPSMPLEKGEVFVAVENITNEFYGYAPGYCMPGTSTMVDISLTF
jgi:iron complex outermembrane receptor protein